MLWYHFYKGSSASDATTIDNKKKKLCGGAHGVMVIVAGNGHGDTSSNPERDWLHFT